MAVAASDVQALWSEFNALTDAQLDAYIASATVRVDLYLENLGIDYTDADDSWDAAERDYAITRLAGHLATAEVPYIVQESAFGTSGSVAFKPGIGLASSPFGQEYAAFLRLKDGSGMSVERTG